MRMIILAGVLISGATLSISAQAADPGQGKQLHDQACNGCHNQEVYTRADRKMHSYEDLVQQMHDCAAAGKMQWSEAQKQDVIFYLNDTFYHFDKK